MKNISGIIWDLDGTLYRYDRLFKEACQSAAARTAIQLGVNLTYEEAYEIAVNSEKKYGNSFRVLLEYGLNYADFHHLFHDAVDITILNKNREMRDLLAALDKPMVILTNASRSWALRTLEHLELKPLFTDKNILSLEDVDYKGKASSPFGFEKALEILGTSAAETLVAEDVARNLVHAKGLGLKTALVHHGQIEKEWDAYVDAYYQDTLDLVRDLLSKPVVSAKAGI
jgi:putative hydrolase of the HAD superfamily